jgi:hypothetical protein
MRRACEAFPIEFYMDFATIMTLLNDSFCSGVEVRYYIHSLSVLSILAFSLYPIVLSQDTQQKVT